MALHIKVRRTRPRVYLSEETIPRLLERAETTHVDEWSQLAVWARGIAKSPPEHRLSEVRLPERARRAAFLYALRHDERDAELALEFAPLLARLVPAPSVVEAMAQLYDSLWAVLPEATRNDLAARLEECARTLLDERVTPAAILDEARTESVAPVLAAGLALYGDRPGAGSLIGGAVHAARDLMGTLQYYLEEDGGFPLGWEASLVHAGAFPKLALLAESGLGQPRPDEVPWLAKYAEFLEAGAREGGTAGPAWPEGGTTGRRLVDLWRILAFAGGKSTSPAAARLLAGMELKGHQDDKILYEGRAPAEGEASVETTTAPATFYRRAGLAVFREDTCRVEIVVRCSPAALGSRSRAGAVWASVAGELVLGAPGRPSMLSVSGSGPAPERPFPRTRRELNLPENRLSEVLAFEGAVGGAFDWIQADLTPAYAPAAARVLRTVVFLRGDAPGLPVLILADEVDLAGEGAEAAEVHHFTSQPDPDAELDVIEIERGENGDARVRIATLLPPESQEWVDEPLWREEQGVPPGSATPDAARSAWRVRIAPSTSGRNVRFLQAIDFPPGGAEGNAGEDAVESDNARSAFVEGAWGAEAGGRLVLLCDETTRRVEGVTAGAAKGVAAVGLAPGARVTLEVAGAGRTDSVATDFGAAWIDAEVPRETGFVMEIAPPDRPPSGRSREGSDA
jgi:hypothetical protein